MPDRIAEPCDPVTLGEERGDRLAGERPGERRAEHDGEDESHIPNGPAAPAGEDEADEAEGRIDEPLVEGIPGAVAGDRPGDRDTAPGYERAPRRGADAPRSIERRHGDQAERGSDNGERGRRDREAAECHHRARAGAPTEEDGARDDDPGTGKCGVLRPRPSRRGGGVRGSAHGGPR